MPRSVEVGGVTAQQWCRHTASRSEAGGGALLLGLLKSASFKENS